MLGCANLIKKITPPSPQRGNYFLNEKIKSPLAHEGGNYCLKKLIVTCFFYSKSKFLNRKSQIVIIFRVSD
jgi:hypothetical protein